MVKLTLSDLPADISSPWSLARNLFLAGNNREQITEILNEAWQRQFPLALFTEDGQLFPEVFLRGLSDSTIELDRPLAWKDPVRSFRVFLCSSQLSWVYFQAAVLDLTPSVISVGKPAEIFGLQRRSDLRVRMPLGTVAILRKDGKLQNSLFVRDISSSGMLVCTGSNAGGIDVDATFDDIVISVPEASGGRGRTLPPIDHGQVVRSFFEEDNHVFCHAVAFKYESAYVRDALRRVSGSGA